MPRTTDPQVLDLSAALKSITGAKKLSDPRIGNLLRRWGTSSRWASSQLGYAATAVQPRAVRTHASKAVRSYATALIPALGACELLLELNAPKTGLRTLSAYFTRVVKALPRACRAAIPRPICTHAQFHACWARLLEPLQLATPVFVDWPPATGVTWPIHSWLEYLHSRPEFTEGYDLQTELTLIIRGDGYPIAGGSLCQLSVSLLEHGKQARRPGFNWILGLAVCHDKDMVALGAIWEELFQVHFCALQRIFVRCCV